MSAADAAFARALELWQAESLQAAHAACLEALACDAGHVAAAVLASEILLRVGEPGPAIALLEDIVVALAPADGAAHVLLARARRLGGEFGGAERAAVTARRLSPQSAEAAAEHALALVAPGGDRAGPATAAGAAAALEDAAGLAGADAGAQWVVADTWLVLGEAARARIAFVRAVALDPGAATWHAAEALRAAAAGRHDEARGLIDRGLALMPGDAELAHMAAAAAGRSPARAASGYVAAHFDAFADSFDDVLVERLGYRLPDLICAALERHVAAAASAPATAQLDVLDAGCGTGLCAARLRPLARRLAGVDLSERMVAHARELGLYDELAVADLGAWLREDERAGTFDAIVAADVLVYFGDLREPLAAAARALRRGGVLVFSTECGGDPDGYALQPSGRFSHDPRYVARVAAEAGFEALECSEVSYRVEGGEPVGSALVCLRLGERASPGSSAQEYR